MDMTAERDERPTKGERREEKRAKERKFVSDNRRSVRMQTMLKARPKKKRRNRGQATA